MIQIGIQTNPQIGSFSGLNITRLSKFQGQHLSSLDATSACRRFFDFEDLRTLPKQLLARQCQFTPRDPHLAWPGRRLTTFGVEPFCCSARRALAFDTNHIAATFLSAQHALGCSPTNASNGSLQGRNGYFPAATPACRSQATGGNGYCHASLRPPSHANLQRLCLYDVLKLPLAPAATRRMPQMPRCRGSHVSLPSTSHASLQRLYLYDVSKLPLAPWGPRAERSICSVAGSQWLLSSPKPSSPLAVPLILELAAARTFPRTPLKGGRRHPGASPFYN